MTLVINKAFATSLSRLIGECELSKEEGFLFAMKGNIQRWFKARFDEIKKRRESHVEGLVQQALNDKTGA